MFEVKFIDKYNEDIEDLILDSSYLPYSYFDCIDRNLSEEYLREYLKILLNNNGNLVAVLKKDNRTMGLTVLEYLSWDSDHFGYACGGIHILVPSLEYSKQANIISHLLKKVLSVARERRYKFLSLKCNSNFSPLIHTLEKLGFLLMDCELILALSDKTPLHYEGHYRIEVLKNTNFDELSKFADVYTLSRFHSDPNIPKQKAEELWRKSIINSCQGFADEVIVIFDQKKPAGFITCMDDKVSMKIFPKKIRSFFLVGVAPEYQGKGVGKCLMQYAIKHSLKSTDLIETETQSMNFAALSLYQVSGFRIVSSKFSFHKWL
jgi:ribosomal protein S18 acetylase RimI-like enzyme